MNESEVIAHLAAIVDSSDDAIISKGLDGTIKSFNRAAEKMFGYKAEEVVGHSIKKIIPQDRYAEESGLLDRLKRGERIDHFATKRQRKDGSIVDVSLTISPVANSEGDIVGASTVARDITDRARRALIEARLAAIVESSDDAIFSMDLDGTILTFNRGAQKMFGYMPEEIIGRSITVLIPPDRQQEEVHILARLRKGEKIDHYETVRMRKDGTLLDVSLSVSPLRDSSGQVIGGSKIARDITAHKHATAQLAAQQEWFKTTLNSIGDAVIACDATGKVSFLNHEAERITGWSFAEATGQPLAEVFHIVNDHTRKRVENPAGVVLRLGHVVGLASHTVLLARDGSERPIADSASPITDSEGNILGVVLVCRDITESKRLEDRASMVAVERERLLESERAARNEAERANRVKDDFVALMSHELRTPLNAILGWTELLTRQGSDAALLARGLEVIAKNTKFQAKLLSDLLDVSRIVSGKLRLERERVDIVGIVRDSLDGVASDIANKGLQLEASLAPGPIEVLGDAARLQQVVLNVLSNAIKFTPSGGRIDVRVERAHDQARISVQDTGIGIAPDVIPHLFERFRQASPMTTRRYGGLGLGLSITKHLLELHDGSIRADSPGENQGALITVELPLLLPEESRPSEHRASRTLESTDIHKASLAGVSILVVEDDPDTRDLVHRLLESYGAAVTAAASALEALDLLERQTPRIMVSDIGLPDVDGYELMQRIRSRNDALARIPAIALTAFAKPEDRTRVLRAGYNAHLSKPVDSAELAAMVSSLHKLAPR